VRRKAAAVNPPTHHVVRGKFIDVQDLQTFLSLSPKVQKQLFAPEERAFFAWWSSSIFEAAATSEPYQEPQSPLTKELSNMDKEFALQQDMLNQANAATGRVDDKYIDCLDTHDIDLTLNDYTDDVSGVYSQEASPQSRRSQYMSEGTSLCREWAIKPADNYDEDWEAHFATSPITPSTPELSDSGNGMSQLTITTPKDDGKKARHWQDPEARWRLKVFLSDPQRFDEAVQHGFPAEVTIPGNSIPSNPLCPPPAPVHRLSRSLCMTPTSTTSIHTTTAASHILHTRSQTLSKSRDSMRSSIHRFEQPLRPVSSGARPLPASPLSGRQSTRFSLDQRLRRRPSLESRGGHRSGGHKSGGYKSGGGSAAAADGGEAGRLMTIKMTLTPSDLRDEEPSTKMTSVTETEGTPAHLSDRTTFLSDMSMSVMGERHPIWNEMPAPDDNKLKRIWRKLKKAREVKT
ncbi:hypothetical protein KEM54_001989, partial [Ascosphaera aggregata]